MSAPLPAVARDPVTLEARPRPLTPEPGPPSQAQPLLLQEAREEEEGEETGVQGARGAGTAEQRRRGWGEAEPGPGEAGGPAGAAGPESAAGSGGWWQLLAWLRWRPPQCCPCAAPLPRAAAHCCHGGTKMAALAYNLGKREINHYFSVRSAKVLALVAVLLLAACHLASRRYRGEQTVLVLGRTDGWSGRRRHGRRRPASPPSRPPRDTRPTPHATRPAWAPPVPGVPRPGCAWAWVPPDPRSRPRGGSHPGVQLPRGPGLGGRARWGRPAKRLLHGQGLAGLCPVTAGLAVGQRQGPPHFPWPQGPLPAEDACVRVEEVPPSPGDARVKGLGCTLSAK